MKAGRRCSLVSCGHKMEADGKEIGKRHVWREVWIIEKKVVRAG